MKSIVVDDKYMGYCMICGKPTNVIHHGIEGVANRKVSDANHILIPLCENHHNMSDMSVHHNNEMRVMCHIISQLAYEKHFIAEKSQIPFWDIEQEARESFRSLFGKSYL